MQSSGLCANDIRGLVLDQACLFDIHFLSIDTPKPLFGRLLKPASLAWMLSFEHFLGEIVITVPSMLSAPGVNKLFCRKWLGLCVFMDLIIIGFLSFYIYQLERLSTKLMALGDLENCIYGSGSSTKEDKLLIMSFLKLVSSVTPKSVSSAFVSPPLMYQFVYYLLSPILSISVCCYDRISSLLSSNSFLDLTNPLNKMLLGWY